MLRDDAKSTGWIRDLIEGFQQVPLEWTAGIEVCFFAISPARPVSRLQLVEGSKTCDASPLSCFRSGVRDAQPVFLPPGATARITVRTVSNANLGRLVFD